MKPRKRIGSRLTPWLAVLLSAAAHALVVLLVVRMPAESFAPPHGDPSDRVAEADEMEFGVEDRPPARPGKSERSGEQGKRVQDDQPSMSVQLKEEPSRSPSQAANSAGDLTPKMIGPGPTRGASNPGSGDGKPGGGQAGAGANWFPPIQQAKSVVYLLDRSLSMGLHHGMSAAQRELLAVLDRMPPSTRFQIIAYNRQIEYLGCDPLAGIPQADESTRERVRKALLEVRPGGSTHHALGLQRGLVFHPEALVLLTDDDELTPREIQEVTYANGGRTSIHVILFHWRVEPNANTPLRQLAQRNHGTYRQVVPEP
jgi:hypothetical protein